MAAVTGALENDCATAVSTLDAATAAVAVRITAGSGNGPTGGAMDTTAACAGGAAVGVFCAIVAASWRTGSSCTGAASALRFERRSSPAREDRGDRSTGLFGREGRDDDSEVAELVEESDVAECCEESSGVAWATPETIVPIPSATAKAPTRPIKFVADVAHLDSHHVGTQIT